VVLWFAGYLAMLSFFVPRHARPLQGHVRSALDADRPIVDTYTTIVHSETVLARQGRRGLRPRRHRPPHRRFHEQLRLNTAFALTLTTLTPC